MNQSEQLMQLRLAALVEYATNDTVYGITREDRRLLNVLRGVNDFAEEQKS